MPVLETVFFYVFALGAIVTSLLVAFPFRPFNNPLYSALALILDFFFFAGLYVLLSAHFMAVVQVLVYGGAIMVLFIFIIMLLNLREEELGAVRLRVHHVIAVVGGIAFFILALSVTAPLVNHQTVVEERNAAKQAEEAKRAAAAESGVDVDVAPEPIATPSGVPGLFADLNEPALDNAYKRQRALIAAGEDSPAARKYPTFEADQRFELPPALRGENPRGGPLEEPVSWGTVEPLSILLVNRFVIPFELTALLLLAAIVGAVIVAKKRL